jgi:hypothetical protein
VSGDLDSVQEKAFLCGTLYVQTGGALCIDSNGNRKLVRKFEQAFPENEVRDRERVLNILEGLIRALPEEGQTFLYDYFAECAVDPRVITSTVNEPMRRLA